MKSTVPKLSWDKITDFEGDKLVAYWDGPKPVGGPVGGWAISRGIHAPDVNQNTVWTQEKSDFRFGQILTEIADGICPAIEPELSDPQLAGCQSITYNLKNGIKKFLESDILKFINEGNYQKAADAFLEYCHSEDADGNMVVNPILLSRRKAERALFLSGTQPEPTPAPTPQPTPDPVPSPAPSGTGTSGGKVNSITTHWQTSLVGVLLIIGALAKAGAELAQGQHVDMTTLGAGLAAGIGFLRTPDSNKVGPKQ